MYWISHFHSILGRVESPTDEKHCAISNFWVPGVAGRSLEERRCPWRSGDSGGFHGHGQSPIAGWFIRENLRENPTSMDKDD